MNAATATVGTVERWHVVGFRESKFQACQGAPIQTGACCQKCGQGIMYVVSLRSSEGRTMDVGRDCAVTLEGGPELAEIRTAERAYERAEWERVHGPRIRAEKEARAAKFAAAAAANLRDHALTMLGLALIAQSERSSAFEREWAQGKLSPYLTGHREDELSEKERAIAFRAIRGVLSAPSTHVGTVGKRLDLVATLEALIVIEGSVYGPKFLHKFRTDRGEVLVWFASGTAGAGHEDVGKEFAIRGTVKEHGTRDGAAQTVLTRCKLG